jgi:AraC family transcriptional regulator, regulatory protein of adaptative response / DNA-3-methyladenine glycosylase II
MTLDSEVCYRAFASRDRRFEGRFVTGVSTTHIYCRPGCPARMPRRSHLRFFACAAAAEEAGFRACLRCRPDRAPGTPAWSGTSATVNRALRLIDDGALDAEDVEALADRLGVTSRHLRRLFEQHLGVSPLALARTRRAHFARRLIDETELPFGEIATSAGFANVRRFNDTIRETFRRTPGELRRMHGGSARTANAAGVNGANARRGAGAITLALRAREPFDGRSVLEFLGMRAIPGLERVANGTYTRSFNVDGDSGTIAMRPTEDGLDVTVRVATPRDLIRIAGRAAHVFDFDADTTAILAHLRRDPLLRRALRTRHDVRVPRAWDAFELAVRAILGQQISVRGAATIASRIVRTLGAPLAVPDGDVTHVFPAPERIAAADLTRIGIPRARARALNALAGAVVSGALRFDALGTLDQAVERLTALPGVGDWTAQYIAMRALGEPDAFPASDLGIAHAVAGRDTRVDAARNLTRAESWRPWRAYAVIALWTQPQPRRSK